jgi:hypothetical protein
MKKMNPIIELLNDYQQLEILYHQDPVKFKIYLSEALNQQPTNEGLLFWYHRINYQQTLTVIPTLKLLGGALLIGLFSWLGLWLINNYNLSPIILGYIITGGIGGYLQYRFKHALQTTYLLWLGWLGLIIFSLWLPPTDSNMVVTLHLPLGLLVFIYGIYQGGQFSGHSSKIAYIRYIGAFFVVYGVIAVLGLMLTGITITLFEQLGMMIAEWYFNNIVIIGVGAMAVVATALVLDYHLADKVASMLARLFNPLVLLTLLGYLTVMVITNTNAFANRDFLLVFNILLLMIMVLITYTLCDSQLLKLEQWIMLLLIMLALVIDVLALIAIIERFMTYGLSPNRITIIGWNLCILGNMLVLLSGFIKYHTQPMIGLLKLQIDYLPVYLLWALVIIVSFPVLF